MLKGIFYRRTGGSDDYALWVSRVGRVATPTVIALVIAATLMGAWSVTALADVCSNERLRGENHSTELPDCRAYELVGTPYKDGYPLGHIGEIAANGERILLEGFGSFAGIEGSVGFTGSVYESVRTPSGWQVKAITPPASRYPRINYQDSSPNLERTLWNGRTATQSADAANLFRREPDGSIVSVGPMLPASVELAPPGGVLLPRAEAAPGFLRYSGASADLSHVFFTIRPSSEEPGQATYVWPGDKTLAGPEVFSLYEYSGLGNSEPKLVGVRNHFHLKSNAEAEMITQCGTNLGFGEFGAGKDVYNAISETGEKVFFTVNPEGCANGKGEVGTGPQSKEVYARVNEEETVAISEPSHKDCEECDTGSPADARFAGASHDGSKVFFMSGQVGLLPGAAGMNLYEYNFAAPEHHRLIRVSVVASSLASEPGVVGIVRVSEDGSRMYFIASEKLVSNKNEYGMEAAKGADNLYVYNSVTGSTTFIAQLSVKDEEDWREEDRRPAQATPNGEVLIFASSALLTPDDHSGVAQLFEYDAGTGELARVSIGQKAPGGYFCPTTDTIEEGYNCDGNTENTELSPELRGPGYEANDHANQRTDVTGFLQISSTGTAAIFLSKDALVPQATNSLPSEEPCRNVYEYRWSNDRTPGAMGRGNVFLVSDGQDVGKANSGGGCGSPDEALMDESGKDILVESTQQLVSQDTNTQVDTYDAREGGGFPGAVSGPGCREDSCQGSLSVVPSLLTAGSSNEAGGGNLVSPAPQSVVKRKSKPPTRAQRLTRALSACRRELNRHKRDVCESQARGRYGGRHKANKSNIDDGHGMTWGVSK